MHDTPTKPHWSLWAIGIFALVWFLMGCANFIYQMMPGAIGSYGEAEQAMIIDRPIWATAGFAVSVFGGLLGAVALLLRRIVSEKLLLASLLGTMVATAYPIIKGINPGLGMLILTTVMPLALGIAFFGLANSAKEKGWLD